MEGYNSGRLEVPATFESVFSHFYFAENRSGETVVRTLLPSYQTIMVFSFGAPASFTTKTNEEISVEKCVVLGPIKQAFTYSLPSGAEIFVCNFKDDAFFRFFGNVGLPGEAAIHPDAFVDQHCFSILWDQLKPVDSEEDRAALLLQCCQPYLRSSQGTAAQLAELAAANCSPIKKVSQENNKTERSIQADHKKYFGYSAKEIYRYRRFLQAIQLIQTMVGQRTKVDWFEIIDQCGYYDQSQLIKDFQHYLRLSPSKYLKFQEHICDPTPQ